MGGGMPYPGIGARRIFQLLTEENYRMPKVRMFSGPFHTQRS